MTKVKRKKTITIETLQRTVIRRDFQQTKKVWCEFCETEVEMISPDLAAKIGGVKMREVFRRIEKGELHFIENETDSLLICVNSLKTK